jgi:hypothetical protein
MNSCDVPIVATLTNKYKNVIYFKLIIIEELLTKQTKTWKNDKKNEIY